jgi:hypothetical protein
MMKSTFPTLNTISWDRRMLRATGALGLLLMFGFSQTGLAQNVTTACTSTSLCLDDSYFVTGDYVVGGVGLRALGDSTGFATGNIAIPDPNAYAEGVPPQQVPAGAEIVAAFLYWETVESSQSAFAGEHGFFNGYPITGTVLGNPNSPTSWSSGGCSGNAQGSKTIRAYRADVRPFLPLDSNGNIQANGQFQVRLADSGSTGSGAPLTLGATLVIIYRVLSPAMPLNAVILYDGAAAPSRAGSNVSQPIVGFYQPATSPVAKITHIVGNGQANKVESVFLNSLSLPSLYRSLPPFPGFYNGSWDNPTWSVNGAVSDADTSETASVVPGAQNSGCVSWGAMIFSTTVQDSDGDGLLDVWEDKQGYIDAKNGQWVSLPGANKNVKDIFVELDYLTNLDGSAGVTLHSHLPKQAALDLVGDTFARGNVRAHFDLGPGIYQNDQYAITYPVQAPPQGATAFPGAGGNAIPESAVLCIDGAVLCPFPGTPAVGWKAGFVFVRDNATVPNSSPAVPLGNFQPGRRLSYHYVFFGHALGAPRSFWSTAGLGISDPEIPQLISIVNSGSTATVTIQSPQGVLKPGDCPNPANTACSDATNGRVTVGGALGQPFLNGTYLFTNPSSTTSNNVTTTTFTLTTASVADGTYNFTNEPLLGVSYLGPTSTSGHSDFRGGGDSAVTFGLWGADDPVGCQADPSQLTPGQAACNNEVGGTLQQAGTLMHELGHSLTLTHGGTYYENAATPSVPTYELNCKPNYLSVMNYLFQVRGFPDGGIDFSVQTLPSLSETALSEQNGIGLDINTGLPAPHSTRWYAPANTLNAQVGQFAQSHCDGTPLNTDASGKVTDPPTVRVDGSTFSAPIDWNNDNSIEAGVNSTQDVNFNGSTATSPDAPFQGFNDWQHADLTQLAARTGAFEFSAGGGLLRGSGGLLRGSGGVDAGGGGLLRGSGGLLRGSGGLLRGSGGTEQDENTANSTADAPQGLTCSIAQGAVPGCGASSSIVFLTQGNSVALTWTPATDIFGQVIGQIRRYDIWRALGSFPTLASVAANASLFTDIQTLSQSNSPPSPMFTDTTVGHNTYTYFVTENNKQGVQSGPSYPIVVNTAFLLTVTANPASMTYGATVLPAFTVSYGGFMNGDTAASLSGTLVCTTTATTGSSVGYYPITCSGQTSATYNISYLPGTLTVNPAPMTITANSASKNYGATLTFRGTEFATSTLYNADKVASIILTSAGATASATVASPGPTYSIVPSAATGTGLGNYTIRYANGTLTVNKDNTSTSIMSSLNPSLSGQSVSFTVTVSNTSGTPAVPTGIVQFRDGLSPLGAPQTVSGLGKATLTTNTLTAGTHSITAVYSNSDGNFISSASVSLTQVVEDFSLKATPSAETISSGHQAIYTVILAPINGLTGSVALSCTGAPPNSACAVSPSTVSVQSSVTPTVTLSPNKNVTHGTFTLTITGTLVGSSLTHSASMQLTVQ